MVMATVLRRLGCMVDVVGSGEAAVDSANDHTGLIFMDIGLPGIQGGHATLLIREKELKEHRRRVPIIALTGHAAREDCLGAGMDDYLQKPALMDDLKGMIDKWAPALRKKSSV
jgi:CheY-like chemotaxis protein